MIKFEVFCREKALKKNPDSGLLLDTLSNFNNIYILYKYYTLSSNLYQMRSHYSLIGIEKNIFFSIILNYVLNNFFIIGTMPVSWVALECLIFLFFFAHYA